MAETRTPAGALIAAVTAAALASGCGGAPRPAAGPAEYVKDGTFTFAIPADPGILDPYRNLLPHGEMTSLTYDSLINVTPRGQIVSGLAATWKADARTATFTLKKGITCSDGSPLTAGTVARALGHLKNPSPLSGLLVPAAPYDVGADEATGTVKVTMKKPFALLIETLGRVPIVCDKGLADPKLLENATVGSGPFVLSKIVRGDTYTFTRRDGYTWGPDGAAGNAPGSPATIVFKVVPNETTRANLLLAGQVNLANVAGPDRERLLARNLERFDLTAMLGELWYNQRDGRPGADPLVRRALTAALDLDELVNVVTSGTGTRAPGLVASQTQPCAADNVTGHLPATDPVRAAALLDQAGWVKGAGGTRAKDGEKLVIDLHYSPSEGEGSVAAAELVSKRWQAVGVTVKLTSDDLAAATRAMFETGDFDAYWAGLRFDLPTHILPWASGAVPPKGQNFTGIDNPDFVKLAGEAAATTGAAGCALWNEAERALLRDADIVPIAVAKQPFFFSKAQGETEGWLQQPIPTSIRVLK
ncbi:ABC transporter substrate-binding protein [Nonomuraea sp. NPDC050394]|uniref:ABC transporter substrate-binding protein n=1 Tax=Nonomuraea sp. NPDC050394 TaxID=3364363 RepID=UPI00378FE605